MTYLHALLLGLIQGITEFLPVSSTAHLTLAEHCLLGRGMPLAFDVLLHLGTLAALLIHFRVDLLQMFRGVLGRSAEGRAMLMALFVAMIPTGVLGLATKSLKQSVKDQLWLYGVFLLLTAVLLLLAQVLSQRSRRRSLAFLRPVDALAIGAIQGLGGGFGLSRSGSTISMGVFLGLDLVSATRFSFLLGIPTIAAAALVEGRHLLQPLIQGKALPADMAFPAGSAHPALLCGIGILAAGLSGYASIGLLDRMTRKPRLTVFAVYCLLLGTGIVIFGR